MIDMKQVKIIPVYIVMLWLAIYNQMIVDTC